MTKIMNWNIQNFGDKRSKRDTIVELIAYQVAKQDIDIFVLIELNTSKPNVAIEILKDRLIPKIKSEYLKEYGVVQEFKFTISARQGSETYAYIYKDSITACALNNMHKDEYDDLTEAHFLSTGESTSYDKDSTEKNRKSDFFPIMEDFTNQWFGRSCCFGAFQLSDNSYLFIVSLHNMASLVQSGPNMHNYDVFDVLNDGIDVTINGNEEFTDTLVFTGDFNVDYLGNRRNRYYYNKIVNSQYYHVGINELTHLKNYRGKKSYSGSDDLRSYCFDNFFVMPDHLNPQNEEVIDIPDWIKANKGVYKTMISDTNLINAKTMEDLARECINNWIEKNIPAKKRQANMSNVILAAKIGYNKIDKESEKALKNLCTNDQMFKNLMNEVNGILSHCTRQFYRFAELRISNRNDLQWYESLLLTRLISDHLPVVIEV